MLNLWHDVKVGSRFPEVANVIIEIPRGSQNKYELDKETGIIRVDRVLYSSSVYPANYGFVPRTFALDNDPLDILVLGETSIHPGCLVKAKPIGVMQMTDEGKVDSKIIATLVGDPEYKDYNDVTDLPDHKRIKLQNFFREYKTLEKKDVVVEDFEGADRAKSILLATHKAYSERFFSNQLYMEDKWGKE